MLRRHVIAVVTAVSLGVAVALPAQAQADPARGQWSAPVELGGTAIHATLLPNGEVLIFEYVEGTPGVDRSSRVRIWDHRTGATRAADLGYDRDLFCASQSVLPDGRVYAAGGHSTAAGKRQDSVGIATTDIYDPGSGAWAPGPVMGEARWYPTNVLLPDGRTLTFGGQENSASPSTTVDAFDPVANTISALPPSATKAVGLNPRMHLLPDGRIVNTGPSRTTKFFDPVQNTWSNGPLMRFGLRNRGFSVQLADLDTVMQIGGANGTGVPTATTEVLDTSAPAPAWRTTAPMNFPRILHNGLVLPDGQVFVVGGGEAFKYTNPVLTPELYDPVADTWTPMAPQAGGRMYHSTLLLLPDGRVMSAGQDFGSLETTAEIFSPPYLFKGPRPTIGSAPSSAGYADQLTIVSPDAAAVSSVVLAKPGSMTHQIDSDQRLVRLDFTASGSTITAAAPASGGIAPPGHYMLFLVDAQGVPSEATWVQLGGPGGGTGDTTAPTTPEALSATPAADRIDLAWTTSTDDVAVTGYTVRRDGVDIGTAPGTTFSDPNTTPGQPYSYTVQAFDAAGNRSPETTPVTATVPEPEPGTGITFRASTTATAVATTSITVPTPAHAPGDLLLVSIDVRGQPTITPPVGWTLVRQDISGAQIRKTTYVRTAGQIEPATGNWRFSTTSANATATAMSYAGVSATTPVATSGGQVTLSTRTIIAPSVDAPAGTVVVGLFGISRGTGIVEPAGMTERAEIRTPASASPQVTSESADLTTTTAGPTGPRTATGSHAGSAIGQLVVLNPRNPG